MIAALAVFISLKDQHTLIPIVVPLGKDHHVWIRTAALPLLIVPCSTSLGSVVRIQYRYSGHEP